MSSIVCYVSVILLCLSLPSPPKVILPIVTVVIFTDAATVSQDVLTMLKAESFLTTHGIPATMQSFSGNDLFPLGTNMDSHIAY